MVGNCLLCAIFQKIKNKKLKVYYVNLRNKDGLPHFIWEKNIMEYYHFTHLFKDCEKVRWYKFLFYKGEIERFSTDFVNSHYVKSLIRIL